MNTYALSICIPTMNRPEYMKGLLDNILDQITEDELAGRLEIVVVDGGVGDATKQLVDAFAARHRDVVYFQRETRSNIDADILKSVELAHGEYCWLFSDDDRFTAHSIRHLLDTLGKQAEVAGCFVNRCSYNSDLTHRVSEPHGWPHALLKRDYLFATKDECFEVLGIDLGFISSQVVKRALWETVVATHDLSPFYQCYLMFYVIGLMMDRNARWLYVDRPLVIQRTGNDSFLAREGFYRRQLLEHTFLGNVVGGHYSTSGVTYRRVFRRMVQRLPRVVA
ncbi:MAG: glycosyltransferase family 2 protein, partial [Bacteroidota bacterium]